MLKISELKPMRSAAGWYVGRDCWESEDPDFIEPWESEDPDFIEPYSRESGYFETWEDAHRWLIQLICKSLISKGIQLTISLDKTLPIWYNIYILKKEIENL